MLRNMLIFMIPFAVIGWMMYSSKDMKSPTQGHAYETYAKPNEGRIRLALQDQLQNPDPACVITASFPFDTSQSAETCDACDALADLGFLDKSVAPATRNGEPLVAVRYELTAAGRALYTETLRDGMDQNLPGLCFGRTVIGELELWAAGAQAHPVVDVRYVPKIENPHEILYTPRARTLGLPQLSRGEETLPRSYACAHLQQGVFSGRLDTPAGTLNGVPACHI